MALLPLWQLLTRLRISSFAERGQARPPEALKLRLVLAGGLELSLSNLAHAARNEPVHLHAWSAPLLLQDTAARSLPYQVELEARRHSGSPILFGLIDSVVFSLVAVELGFRHNAADFTDRALVVRSLPVLEEKLGAAVIIAFVFRLAGCPEDAI